MSSSVLPSKSAIAAFHVPETVLPFCMRADQVPRQPFVDFWADQVPSRTTWLLSLKSAQEPLAAFLVSGRTRADQRPRRNRLGPAVAIQLPCSAGGACWARAQKATSRVTAKVHFFMIKECDGDISPVEMITAGSDYLRLAGHPDIDQHKRVYRDQIWGHQVRVARYPFRIFRLFAACLVSTRQTFGG